MGTPVALPPQSNREGERQKAPVAIPHIGTMISLPVASELWAASRAMATAAEQATTPSALRIEVSQRSDALETVNP